MVMRKFKFINGGMTIKKNTLLFAFKFLMRISRMFNKLKVFFGQQPFVVVANLRIQLVNNLWSPKIA